MTLFPGEESDSIKLDTAAPAFTLPSLSPRAEAYRWLRHPTTVKKGRLIESIAHLHGLRHDFFQVSLVSHERGLSTITHNTDDYNVGHSYLALYLQDACRVDDCLEQIDRDLATFSKASFSGLTHVRSAKRFAYEPAVSATVDALFKDRLERPRPHWTCGRDVILRISANVITDSG